MDYSILVGNPAVCIKRYDIIEKCWRITLPNGDFISDGE